MPPAARKYGPVAYSKHPAGTKRPSSLSLSEMMGSVDCKELDLLSVAFSDLSSNHSDSLEVIPPFPRIRKPTVAEFINLRSNLLCSQGSPLIGECSVLRNRGKVVTTGPTAPRLKTMLREVVSVKKWRVRLAVHHAPHSVDFFNFLTSCLGECVNSVRIRTYPVGWSCRCSTKTLDL